MQKTSGEQRANAEADCDRLPLECGQERRLIWSAATPALNRFPHSLDKPPIKGLKVWVEPPHARPAACRLPILEESFRIGFWRGITPISFVRTVAFPL
jgi:hypothetical protein